MSEDSFTHDEPAVRAEMATTASPDQVWRAFADPGILSGWFTDRARGRARPGATMTWCFDRFRMELPYEVLVADAGERLVLKGSPVGRPPYLFEVRIERDADLTRLKLVNSGFSFGQQTEEQYEGVLSGWQMALAILKQYLENHFGRTRETFFAMQPAPFAYEQMPALFRQEAGLARWLTERGSVGNPGDRYSLTLRGGEAMTGTVLAVTSREVALSWEEIGGVVELKAFQLGPRARAVSVRGCGWGLAEERAEGIERMMAGAIDRLVAALHDPR
ncbi:MAG TPA: SRPBCC domain-containing protein [Candidatus Polarisedimenticolia bacterium]